MATFIHLSVSRDLQVRMNWIIKVNAYEIQIELSYSSFKIDSCCGLNQSTTSFLGDKVLVSLADVNGVIEHAYASTDSGTHSASFQVHDAFDNDPSTSWHDDGSLTINSFRLDFFVSQNFL